MRRVASFSALALAALVVAAADAASQSPSSFQTVTTSQGTIVGSVRGELDGQVVPLSYALVEIVTNGVRLATSADEVGRYSVAVSAGEVELSVQQIGYESLTVRVTVLPSDSVSVDLELTAAPVALPPVDIRGGPVSGRVAASADGSTTGELGEVDLQALDVGPGVGQPGLADVVAALPGNDPDDATDVLFMRGSSADLKLVLLDGVPVYTPFHVAGLMRSFEQSVLGGAELHVGGAPARFDGGLTHILELRTRPARRDRVRVSGSIDLLAASGAVEAPLGDHSGVVASGRTLHDLGHSALGGMTPYGYRDLLVAASAEPASGHELRATGFVNEESVLLDSDYVRDARWANRAGSIGYRGAIGTATLEVSAGLSGYRAALPLQPSAPLGPSTPSAILANAATDRLRMIGEVSWGAAHAPVRFGVSYEEIAESFLARQPVGGSISASAGSTRATGAFFDFTRPLARGVTLRAGLRADHFSGAGVSMAPRGMIAWAVAPEALLSLAVGRYHQPTRSSDVNIDLSLAELAHEGLSAGRLGVATADHVVVGLDQRLTRSIRMDLQGFWKGYRGLPSSNREAVRSSGIDVRVVTAADGRAAWLGYGLAWYWSTIDLSGGTPEFAGRHLLSAGVAGQLVGPLQAEARMAYGSGLPYTSIPFGTGPSHVLGAPTVNQVDAPRAAALNEPIVDGLDDAFLRLDLEVMAELEPTWGGRPWRVRPYVRILNALDRRDALFYTFERWRSDSVKPVASRPLLPLVGVAFSF